MQWPREPVLPPTSPPAPAPRVASADFTLILDHEVAEPVVEGVEEEDLEVEDMRLHSPEEVEVNVNVRLCLQILYK